LLYQPSFWETGIMQTIENQTDDSLEMVWEIREKIYEATKDMDHEAYRAYLRKHVESFERRLAALRKGETFNVK